MQRIIAEEEPPRPSHAAEHAAGEQLTIVANEPQHGADQRLRRHAQGDLDWIVMKALEKDRTRRYETPNGLAADIERHLSNEPVLAVRSTLVYQLSKLYRRHKWALATAGRIRVGAGRRRLCVHGAGNQEQVIVHGCGRGAAEGDERARNGKPNSGA